MDDRRESACAARPGRRPPGARAGFTITELVVVIAVIAVIAAILVPTVRRVTASARTAKCLSNHRQLTLACVAYSTSNAGRLVCPRTDPSRADLNIQARVDGADVPTYLLEWSHWWVRSYADAGHVGLVTVDGRPYETTAAITASVLFPYAGSAQLFVSPDEPAAPSVAAAGGLSTRVRSYSINSLLGVTRPNENKAYDRTFTATMQGVRPEIDEYNTSALGRIRNPSRMLSTIVEDDPANYNTQGWVIYADQQVWTDFPAPWRPDAITISYVDGSTQAYALANPRLPAAWLAAGHGYRPPADPAASVTIDWRFFRDRLNPGVIPGSLQGFGGN